MKNRFSIVLGKGKCFFIVHKACVVNCGKFGCLKFKDSAEISVFSFDDSLVVLLLTKNDVDADFLVCSKASKASCKVSCKVSCTVSCKVSSKDPNSICLTVTSCSSCTSCASCTTCTSCASNATNVTNDANECHAESTLSLSVSWFWNEQNESLVEVLGIKKSFLFWFVVKKFEILLINMEIR